MKPRDAQNTPSTAVPATPGAVAPRRSGRVQFDSRGQAVWEWAVKTGMFDRNASTQRIKALVETPLALSEDPKPAAETTQPDARPAPAAAQKKASPPRAGSNPYERAEPTPKLRPGESAGFDPYSSGPARPRGPR